MHIRIDVTGSPEQASAEIESVIQTQVPTSATESEKYAAEETAIALGYHLAAFRPTDTVRVQANIQVDRV